MTTSDGKKVANPPAKEQKSTPSENPMKSVKTKPLPTQVVFFSKHRKKKRK